uniref:KIB1-4 beta-propeller domain-containing protein n=1 Tax=Ananas comosus var. bracteatus TaxID=296719 RepID=A0A6V7PYL5_ANACO|nr:unnamed protein product [Ananas comosus var. bracteatus]
MANEDDRRPHKEEEEEEEEKAAAATTSDDAIVTCRKTMITASVACCHLLFDVLHNVAAQLDPPSFVCFRETCSAWRSAAVAVTDYPYLQRKNSLLALSADPEGDFRRLISPSLNLQLSDSSYHFRCCGLFDNWIATVTASGRVFLLRQVPATARVELPPISTLTLPPWFVDNADKWQKNPSYVKKIVLSAPPDSPDCLAVAVYWFNHLAACRQGDAEWTAVLEPRTTARKSIENTSPAGRDAADAGSTVGSTVGGVQQGVSGELRWGVGVGEEQFGRRCGSVCVPVDAAPLGWRRIASTSRKRAKIRESL